jgi:hypothetical protein
MKTKEHRQSCGADLTSQAGLDFQLFVAIKRGDNVHP